MDEATLFKFGKWIDYGKSHRRGEKFPLKGVWSGSRDPFSCKDEATLFKFGKWVEYGRVHRRDEKFLLKETWSGSHDRYKNFTPPPPSTFLE